MNPRACVIGKIASGDIPEGQAEHATAMLDAFEAEYQARMPFGAAQRQAALDAGERLARDAALKRRNLAKQVQAQRRIDAHLAAHPRGVVAAARSVLTRALDDISGFENLEARVSVVRAEAHAMLVDLMARGRARGLPWIQDLGAMRSVVRALHGEGVAPEFQHMAKAWADTAEYLRLRFNAAGGDIADRVDWRLPQRHNPERVAEVEKAEWVRFTKALVDPARMHDPLTGLPMSPERLELALNAVHDSVRSDGATKRVAGAVGGKTVAHRHAEHRLLVFKDADAWLAYQDRFGEPNIFETMMDHVSRMSADIAAMEVLGPNPDATMRRLLDQVADADPLSRSAKAKDSMRSAAWQFGNMYEDMRGRLSTPVDAAMARGAASVRSLLVAAQLGSAVISAFSDTGFSAMTARFNGLFELRGLGRHVQLMASDKTRRHAVRLGLLADGWIRATSSGYRFTGEMLDRGFAGQLADATLSASGLSLWTNAGQWAFGMEFLGRLGELRESAFDDLPDALRATLDRYGLHEAHWDVIRSAELDEGFARPSNIRALDRVPGGLDPAEVADRLHRMVLTERDYAVPTVDAYGRQLLQQGTRAGTPGGEVVRAVAMYKGFPVTILTTHGARATIGAGDRWSKVRYGATLLAVGTLLGMVSLQSKQILRGHEPLPTDPSTELGRKAWGAALAQGGGLGILGDFLFHDHNRFGQSFTHTLLGPVAGAIDDAARLSLGNAFEALAGEETHMGREVVQAFGRYAPGSSLWHTRLAFERLVMDQAALLVDPDMPDRWRRLEARAARERGQQSWWKRGQTTPEALR